MSGGTANGKGAPLDFCHNSARHRAPRGRVMDRRRWAEATIAYLALTSTAET
jgi:hypothetical protein